MTRAEQKVRDRMLAAWQGFICAEADTISSRGTRRKLALAKALIGDAQEAYRQHDSATVQANCFFATALTLSVVAAGDHPAISKVFNPRLKPFEKS